MDMMEEFKESTVYAETDYDPSKVSETFINAIEDRERFCFVVVTDDHNVARGVLLGTIQEQLFNRERTAFEIVWWVSPEHRNLRASVKLFEAFEYWAKKLNCKYIQTGAAQNTESTTAVEKFYDKKKYKKVESNFIKAIA
jgi:GNAT superfamily N-acetyltransferase